MNNYMNTPVCMDGFSFSERYVELTHDLFNCDSLIEEVPPTNSMVKHSLLLKK